MIIWGFFIIFVETIRDMEDLFATYEQALALKELGFDKPCWCYFVNDVFFDSMFPKDYDYFEHMNKKMEYTLAPLKSQVFKWFRDKHSLDSEIYMNHEFGTKIYTYLILQLDRAVVSYKTGSVDVSKSYEEAESACIDELISIIKEKKS